MVDPKHEIGRDYSLESGVQMRPKEKVKTPEQGLLGNQRLELILQMDRDWSGWLKTIDWEALAEAFSPPHSEKTRRPGIPVRTMGDLVILQHTFGMSDEQAAKERPERPYWQFFSNYRTLSRAPGRFAPGAGASGEGLFQHDLALNFSQIWRWWKRIGKEGLEQPLKLTIKADRMTRTVTPNQMQVVVVDPTVQPKAIKRQMKRRLGIEPEIVHQKPDDNLGWNLLKGLLGDAQNTPLCASDHNMRKIHGHLSRFFALIGSDGLAVFNKPLPRILFT